MPDHDDNVTNITRVDGLLPGTVELNVPLESLIEEEVEEGLLITQTDKKISVNEVASEVFLRNFYIANNLSDPGAIARIETELRVVCENSTVNVNVAVKSIVEQLYAVRSRFDPQKSIYITYNLLYTSIMSALSSIAINIGHNNPSLIKLYKSIFDNDTLLIQTISKTLNLHAMYKTNLVPRLPCEVRFKQALGKKTIGLFNEKGETIGNVGLLHPESHLSKFSGVVGIYYAPQLYNNIPYVYDHKVQGEALRLRIGTQIEQTLIQPSVPNIFKNFLKALNAESRAMAPNKTNYLYINLQKASNKLTDGIERQAESLRTNALHGELSVIPGVEVVTLPADNSNFLKDFSKHKGHALITNTDADFEKLSVLFDDICKSIFYNSNDFNIPYSVQTKIFEKHESVSDIKLCLRELFYSAAKDIIGDNMFDQVKVSMEQRQAIYFHFVKHKFTNLIIFTLNPNCFNISCKDAIDRAGVHNLWNIICNRIDRNQTVSLEFFETLLNMPAILVKDRPINDHVNILSNALGHLYFHLSEEKKKLIPWAPDWLKINTCWSEQEVSTVYTWSYNSYNKSKQDEYNLMHVKYNTLYSAVDREDRDEVNRMLSDSKKLSHCTIYDNDKDKNDTILMCAARNGCLDIFCDLLEKHDKLQTFSTINPLSNLRSEFGKRNNGTILTCLFKCLETESADIDSTMSSEEYKDKVHKCIESYLVSILSTKGIIGTLWSTYNNYINSNVYYKYSNKPDEDGLTPMMHLARTGNYQLLHKLASICSQQGHDINKVFDLKYTTSTNKKSLLEFAADSRQDQQHDLFIATLLALTKSNAEIIFTEETFKMTCEVFLQTLLDIKPKTNKTIDAITLMAQLINQDHYAISESWVKSVKGFTQHYGNVPDSYIKTMFEYIKLSSVTITLRGKMTLA